MIDEKWHRANRLAPRASIEARVEWHVAHAAACGCRSMPEAIWFEAIARGAPGIAAVLDRSPELVTAPAKSGGVRRSRTEAKPAELFLEVIKHHVYAGDTPLHIAAAAYDRKLVRALLARGAAVDAMNRRGAQPIHYAADGSPDLETWNPKAQAAVIRALVAAGADPNALDKDGVGPLHRAVRTRCTGAVRALLEAGADADRPNARGSTPLALAQRDTGRGGAGSEASRAEQKRIIALLDRPR